MAIATVAAREVAGRTPLLLIVNTGLALVGEFCLNAFQFSLDFFGVVLGKSLSVHNEW